MSNKSGVAEQVISLPKGGGALKGIGETFSPDLHTGTGNFTVPIGLPPGRNGFQPKIDLVYSTGNGNSPFGLGWSLSIPGVSRKTSKGIPTYNDIRDTFLLSGAEDLVPIDANPAQGIRYRPRTEGLFARITHRQNEIDDYWEVRSKDGLVSWYGTPGSIKSDLATVVDPSDATRIFAWHLTRTTDTFGNRIEYLYEHDALPRDGPHEWDQLYLKTVRYIDYGDPDSPQFLVTVTFLYEPRPDPFSVYRSGFEIRTIQRCTRIEIRTHAEIERRTRVYHLIYLDQAGTLPERLPANGLSLLSGVEVVGHDGEQTERLPPLEFTYTEFNPTEQRYQPWTTEGLDMPGRSLAHPDFELVDLFGQGLPDVVQMNGIVRYWRNLGEGKFARPREMASAPAGAQLADKGVILADLDGDGHADLLISGNVRNGYFPLNFEGEWSERSFVSYQAAPTFDLEDPELRLVDLDGDGITDALRTGTSFELYYHSREAGWTQLDLRERRALDEFPNVSFSDPRVKLADMTGDNLQDIVLVQDGHIDYWPYLGYGQWGRRITMEKSPHFLDGFAYGGIGYDPKRVLVGDVDGDGLADLVYVESGRVTIWLNQSGNRWSSPITIAGTPPITDMDAVRLADMLGTGTTGILWTYDFGALNDSTYKFLNLTGGVKPYVLHEMNNHMGARTLVEYAPSTRYYLEDEQQPETRWQTHLPFPVQVVACVEVIDEISKGKLTTEYRYHQGYWDGEEREFRGFGMVEQLDAEIFERYHAGGLHGTAAFNAVTPQQFSPPILTRTWFHQGAIRDEHRGWSEPDQSRAYWPDDPPAFTNNQRTELTVLLQQADRDGEPRRARAALRALRGTVLRSELYALDGSVRQNRPYTVTESLYDVRELDPPQSHQADREHIYFPHALGQRTTQWERGTEPMTQFSFTDGYDQYGRPKWQLAVAVPRDRDPHRAAPAGEPYLSTYATTDYTQRDDDQRYIIDRAVRSTGYEVINDGSLSVWQLRDTVTAGAATLNINSQSLTFYDGTAFTGLPYGQLGDHGAATRTETLVLTDEILQEAYRPSDEPSTSLDRPPYLYPDQIPQWTPEYPEEFRTLLPPELVGYVYHSGGPDSPYAQGYFVLAERRQYDVQGATGAGRGLMTVTRDPLDRDTSIAYDTYQMFPIRVTDPIGLTIEAGYNYRVMQTSDMTDINGNQTSMRFSPLGLPTATFITGRAAEGDQQRPSTRLEYDMLAFSERSQPIWVRTIRHSHHDSEMDVSLPERDETIESIEYSDGFGRILQTCAQAEDVLFGDQNFGGNLIPIDQAVSPGDTIGRRLESGAPPNVIVSGWQVYDNKGQVVEKYEPFFSEGWDYQPPREAQLGQKVRMEYDPRGQMIRTINPDGSEQRVIYGVPVNLDNPGQYTPTPWEAYTYDANDNAGRTHPNDSTLYRSHWNTSASIVIDALGRTVSATARNGIDPATEWYTTRSTYDIRGNVLTVTDALNRVAFRYTYDLANRPWRIDSIDAGLRRMVLNAVGNEIERRDSKGALILQGYDVLHRPCRLWARDNGPSPVTLRQRMVYGDEGRLDQPSSARAEMRNKNLLGQVHRHHDEAGLLVIEAIDFKGNVLEKVRRVIADAPILEVFDGAIANDWRVEAFRMDWQPLEGQTLADREGNLLDLMEFRTSATYDALNRVKRMQYPQDVDGRRKELRPGYNRAGTLEQVSLDGTIYVERIVYDAKGQRTLIAYGNGVMTRYGYDTQTFRLKRLRSERYSKPNALTYHSASEPLQDFGYQYDLAGNIHSIIDRTPESGILNNPQAGTTDDTQFAQLLASGDALIRQFTYDPIYRLRTATGRECDSPPEGVPWSDQPRCTARTRTRAYTDRYWYDLMGNILRLEHKSRNGDFTRRFDVESANNRLKTVTIGETLYDYHYDPNGNLTAETSSRHFEWNHSDQMKAFSTRTEGAEPSVHAHYLYDASGMRVKKIVRKQGGLTESSVYVDDLFEHHRWQTDSNTGENTHLHLRDDQQRIALIRVGQAHPEDQGPALQFHLSDHLGSSGVVVDQTGAFINREEYTPYGETSFGSFAKKRFRFTGKERDEENGLSYHLNRYYSPYLTRWVSCDPIGAIGGANLYRYSKSSPLRYSDVIGSSPEDTTDNIGNVAPYNKQPRGPRDWLGKQVEEKEHVEPKKQLEELTKNPKTGKSDYSDRHYRKDTTVVVERNTALNKTHGNRGGSTADNPRTKALLRQVKSGRGINYRKDIFLPSLENAKRARAATRSRVTDPQINRAILGQDDNLFALQRLDETAAIIRDMEVPATTRVTAWDRLAKGAVIGGKVLNKVVKVLALGEAVACGAEGDIACLAELGADTITFGGYSAAKLFGETALEGQRGGYQLGQMYGERILQDMDRKMYEGIHPGRSYDADVEEGLIP